MLSELLILYVLMEGECSIYRIKKEIDGYFHLFYTSSMGSLHPAIKKLHSNRCLTVKKQVSTGGQRRFLYSATSSGKKYFKELMLNPDLSDQLVKIKLLMLPKMEKNLQIAIINNIKDYYREKLLDYKTFYETCPINYIKHCINSIQEEIKWLETKV